MKHFFIKISSLFFLTLLLSSNIVNLHVYFHNQIQELEQCQNHDDEQHSDDVPCDLCVIAFNLNNLDFNNTSGVSFESLIPTQQHIQKKILGFVASLHNQFHFNKNRNKAPPHLV